MVPGSTTIPSNNPESLTRFLRPRPEHLEEGVITHRRRKGATLPLSHPS